MRARSTRSSAWSAVWMTCSSLVHVIDPEAPGLAPSTDTVLAGEDAERLAGARFGQDDDDQWTKEPAMRSRWTDLSGVCPLQPRGVGTCEGPRRRCARS